MKLREWVKSEDGVTSWVDEAGQEVVRFSDIRGDHYGIEAVEGPFVVRYKESVLDTLGRYVEVAARRGGGVETRLTRQIDSARVFESLEEALEFQTFCGGCRVADGERFGFFVEVMG